MPRLVEATAANRKLRIAIFGKGGSGKTHFALSAPSPAIFDIEGKHPNFVGVVPRFQNVEFDQNRIVGEFAETLSYAMAGRFSGVQTLVVDSWTMVEKAYRATMDDNLDGSTSQLARGRQRERIELDLLDSVRGTSAVHLIFIAHEGNAWSEEGKLRAVGKKPEATKNFEHYFDLVLNFSYDAQKRRRFATVTKSNVSHLFPVGYVIENPTFESLLPMIADPHPAQAPAAHTREARSAARPAQTATPAQPAAPPRAIEPQPAVDEEPAIPVAADGGPILLNSAFNEMFSRSGAVEPNWVAWLQNLGVTFTLNDNGAKVLTREERERASMLVRAALLKIPTASAA